MTARRLITAGAIAGLAAWLVGSVTASAAVIGVVAPQSGPFAPLGQQVFQGARAAAEATGDTIVEIDETCEENDGNAVARQLLEAKAEIAVGFLCIETLSTALPQLKAADLPAVSISARSKVLMEDALRNGWAFYRMAPVEGDEAEKLSEVIFDLWKADPIALVEDGTIYGRELASAIRQQLEPKGITPVFTDTFRPGQEQQVALVRRLAKAGARRVFVGGDRNDLAIIARDAASENIPLTLIGGDVLRAANRPVPLRDGVLAVALPDYAALPSATTAVTALWKKNIDPDGYMVAAYAAVELAHQAIVTANGGSVTAALKDGSFDTAIGTIAFDDGHELKNNPFRLQEWQGASFTLSPRSGND